MTKRHITMTSQQRLPSAPTTSGGNELVPFLDHVSVLVHHRVPARNPAHALGERPAVAHGAGSAIAFRFDTPVPNWRSVTFLMFCAQIVGNPVTAPLAAATPAVARRERRPSPRDRVAAMERFYPRELT